MLGLLFPDESARLLMHLMALDGHFHQWAPHGCMDDQGILHTHFRFFEAAQTLLDCLIGTLVACDVICHCRYISHGPWEK